MDAQTTIGICCRVWLPDAVLSAGQSLRVALEGVNGSNFMHLRSKYPSAEFKVFGAASLALPPAQRLHVAARCRDLAVLEQLEVDVVDLAETACDIVADTLNLSDEQVQECFEKIRVEKHETYFGATAPKAGAAGPPGSVAGAVSKAMPPRPPKLDNFTVPLPQPLTFPPLASPLGSVVANPQASALAPPPVLPTGLPGQPPALWTLPGSTGPMMFPSAAGMQMEAAQAAQKAQLVQAAQQQLQQLQQQQQQLQQQQQQQLQQQQLQKQRRKQQQPQQQQPTGQQHMPPPPVPVLKDKKQKSKKGSEIAAKQAQPQVQAAAGDQTREAKEAKKRSREEAKEAKEAKRRKLEAAKAAAFAAELRVPQAGQSQQPEQRQASAADVNAKGVQPEATSAAAPATAPVKTADSTAPEPAVASSATPSQDGQLPPHGDPKATGDPYQAPLGTQGEGGDSAEGSASSSDEGSSYEEEEEEDEAIQDEPKPNSVAPLAPVRMKLFKLGDLCCDVWARFVSGNEKGGALGDTMHIDQRVKVERCSEHFQWAGKLATVWRLAPVDETGRAGYYALSDYFLEKGRVGLVETKWYAVYILPAALGKEYLAGLGITGSRRLVGLQVPTALRGETGT